MEDRIINKKWTKNRSTFLLVGFVLSLFVVFSAFEWAVPLNNTEEKEIEWLPPVDMHPIQRTTQRVIRKKPPIKTLQKEVKIDIPPKIVTETIDYIDTDPMDNYDEAEDFTGEEFVEETKKAGKIEMVKKEVDVIHFFVSRMPVFGDCRDIDDKVERGKCSEKALIDYMYSNVTYPNSAKANNIEGTVYAEIVIGKEGEIESYKIVKSPNPILTKEVEKMISKMPTWQAGMNNFRPVKVKFTIPVTFELN